MRQQFDRLNWERSAHQTMKHVWLSDCNSLVTHLHNSNDARLENVRTAMDVSVLRQRLWLDADGEPYDTPSRNRVLGS